MEPNQIYDTLCQNLIDGRLNNIKNNIGDRQPYTANDENILYYIFRNWEVLGRREDIEQVLEYIISSQSRLYKAHIKTWKYNDWEPYIKLLQYGLSTQFINLIIIENKPLDIIRLCISIIQNISPTRWDYHALELAIRTRPEIINMGENNYGSTLIMFAAQHNNLYYLKLLIENGADLYIKNTAGYDALHYAFTNFPDKPVCFQYLIENYLHLDSERYNRYFIGFIRRADNSTRTKNMIECLLKYGKEKAYSMKEAVLSLITYGFLTDAYNNINENNTNWAGCIKRVLIDTSYPSFQNRQPRTTIPIILERLITMGADVNEIDDLGNTPLFYANRPDIIELLIHYGAYKHHRNNDGKTAYDVGETRNLSLPCLKLLNISEPKRQQFHISASHLTKKMLVELLKRAGCDDVEVLE